MWFDVACELSCSFLIFHKLSETFIVNKFLGLRENGLDVHIVCEETDSDEVEDFPRLQSNRTALARVHESWPHRPKFLAALLTPFALLRCLILNPTGQLAI